MDIISLYRKAHNLTQGQLAERAGLYQMAISRAERRLKAGRGIDPEIARALDIATAGKLPLLQLLFPDEYNKKQTGAA